MRQGSRTEHTTSPHTIEYSRPNMFLYDHSAAFSVRRSMTRRSTTFHMSRKEWFGKGSSAEFNEQCAQVHIQRPHQRPHTGAAHVVPRRQGVRTCPSLGAQQRQQRQQRPQVAQPPLLKEPPKTGRPCTCCVSGGCACVSGPHPCGPHPYCVCEFPLHTR